VPNAVPANAASTLPPARMIDPRGHRFGAAVSAGILIVAFLAGAPALIGAVLLSIGVSAAFGMRYSVYGMLWRRLVRAFRLPVTELEHEYPPRFAQTLGSVALIVALVAFILGLPGLGWVFVLGVAALQTLLAVTGYCLGCRLYFLRWWVPSVVTDVWSRAARRQPTAAAGTSRISYR
jgi:hypothetical protein